MPQTQISEATTDEEIGRCFPVMAQLRPHLAENGFVAAVRRQQAEGFRLVKLEDGGMVRAVAGFRFINNLYARRILYVDDLVTDATVRSRGYGKTLLDWLVALAREAECEALELDSGVQRFDAHRFYLANRMIISGHHFRLTL